MAKRILCIRDSILRLIPGVVGNKKSIKEESFENGLLEYPQYTKPKNWEKKALQMYYYLVTMVKLRTGVYLNQRL